MRPDLLTLGGRNQEQMLLVTDPEARLTLAAIFFVLLLIPHTERQLLFSHQQMLVGADLGIVPSSCQRLGSWADAS